jgi:PAS domain S-box-containing protein
MLNGKESSEKDSVISQAAKTSAPTIISCADIKRNEAVVGGLVDPSQSLVLLPLRSGDATLGLLGAIVSQSASLDISFLITISQQAVSAIENAQLREENRTWRERLDAVFERMAEPVLVFDHNGKLALLNDAAIELMGDRGVKEGDSIEDLAKKVQLSSSKGLIPSDETAAAQALEGNRVENYEENILLPNGDTRYYLTSAVPIDSAGGLKGAVVVWRDITYIKELERQRAEFLSMVSHELRTPLTSVLGYSQIMQRLIKQGIELNALEKPLEAVVDQTKRVNTLVEDLLDASRAEVGRLKIEAEKIDLASVIRKSVNDSVAADRNHQYVVELPPSIPPVRADPGRIEQVVRNLLNNAMKYSPAGTTITVRGIVEHRTVVVSVSDQGRGIAKEDIPTLFLPFHRVRQVAGREVKGMGLGLFISRSIIEALGGNIWVRSELGKGSTFCFSLPKAQ